MKAGHFSCPEAVYYAILSVKGGMAVRRFMAWLLAMVLALALTGCGKKAPAPVELPLMPAESAQTVQPETAPPPSQEAEEAPSQKTDETPSQAAVPDDDGPTLEENGSYDSKDDVALYLHMYGHLPPNYITKKDARALGWEGGSVERYAPGKCIGGDRFGNYEGLLPEKAGRSYTECDIDPLGSGSRGARRIIFSNDGLIYYTDDHYKSFTLLYGEVGT